MTTIYVPRLIESAEQAEALPIGTLAHRVLKFESTWDTVEQPEVAVKVGINAWCSTAVDDDAWDWLDRHLVGWTALVPIEAEEEGTREFHGSNGTWHMTPPVDAYQSPHTRYVTPWEEA